MRAALAGGGVPLWRRPAVVASVAVAAAEIGGRRQPAFPVVLAGAGGYPASRQDVVTSRPRGSRLLHAAGRFSSPAQLAACFHSSLPAVVPRREKIPLPPLHLGGCLTPNMLCSVEVSLQGSSFLPSI